MLREAAIANYRGHAGYVLCVDWSPVDPDVIWTGGKDFTVQEWRVSKQEFTVPPKGEAKPLFCVRPPPLCCHSVTFVLTLAGKKITKLKEKTKQNKKNKKASGTESPALLEMNGEPAAGGQKAATAEQPSGEDEEEEVSSTSSSAPPGNSRNHSWCRFL